MLHAVLFADWCQSKDAVVTGKVSRKQPRKKTTKKKGEAATNAANETAF